MMAKIKQKRITLSTVVGLAPTCTSFWTISICPPMAAWCRAVWWSISSASKSTRSKLSSKKFTTSSLLFRAAHINNVYCFCKIVNKNAAMRKFNKTQARVKMLQFILFGEWEKECMMTFKFEYEYIRVTEIYRECFIVKLRQSVALRMKFHFRN